MGGSSVRITTFGYPPKIYETATEDGGVLFTGYEVDMLKILGKRLNFQPRFRKTTDGHKWGAFFAQNETYNGLKGALHISLICFESARELNSPLQEICNSS